MKTKTYKTGTTTCRTYLKTAGNGWECGFTFGGRTMFVGNFVYANEAAKWYATMNRDIRAFTKKFKVGPGCPKSWYANFLKNYLYTEYYNFCDRAFTKHTKTFRSAFTSEVKRYRRMNRNWYPGEKKVFLKAA
jgi:hypothetical protein